MNRIPKSKPIDLLAVLRRTLLPSLLGIILCILSAACGAATGWTWVWSPDGFHAPETLYFRQRFHLEHKPVSVELFITADDAFIAYLNERATPIGEGNDWTTVQGIDVSRYLRSGDNLFCVQCRNTGGPGGLLYKFVIKEAGNKTRVIYSDSHVRVNRHPPLIWTTFALDDAMWPPAKELAPANGGVWGPLRGAPQPDPARIVRLWNIRTGDPAADPYARPRNVGERMLLSASVASASEMQMLAGAGFTLFQTESDHLSTEEVAPNQWDWNKKDAARAEVQKLGLDWCYFEHEAFPPKWYRDTVPFTRIQCLEHQQPVQAFSPWDPKWPGFIAHGYEALARQFGTPAQQKLGNTAPLVSALNVGVHGDYGDAGLLTGARVLAPNQRAAWIQRFGNDHDHLGFWCNDPLARADFRNAIMQKYGSLEALNLAWNTAYRSPKEIAYPANPGEEPEFADRRHYLDFISWYQESVGIAVETNLRAARERFPATLLMVPAGFEDENVRGGNDNSLIPKLAAKYHAAVRSTHGGFKPFADNAATMYGRLGSASRFYGAPFWTEPPVSLTPNQTVERIFEAVSQGATGYFDWAADAIANRDLYYRYGRYLRVEKPIVDVAMFYPAMAQDLRPDQGYANTFWHACAYLRDYANYDIVDDRMVNDGCLANYRILALWEGTVCDQPTLDKIKAWVDAGGVLLAYDFGKVTNIAGDTGWFKDLFGYVQDLAPARISERYTGNIPPQYQLSAGEPQMGAYFDGAWYDPEVIDGVAQRWAGASAQVFLPVDPDHSYGVLIQATVPPEAAGLKHEVLINGHKVGEISSVGDVRYRFLIPDEALNGKSVATLTLQSETFRGANAAPVGKDTRVLGLRVQSIIVTEVGAGADQLQSPLLPPPGLIRRELDLNHLSATDSNQSWVRRYGNGLTIYFPANRSLIKGYIEVIQRAIYHLSATDPTRRDALPVDGGLDGVYATLFSDKILYYNSKDTPVTKKVTISAAAFAAWKDVVTTPAENSWTLELKPHSIGAINFIPQPQELLFECEQFLELGGLKPAISPGCSPGEGPTCVIVPHGASISTRIKVEVTGTYNLFVRTLRNGKLEPVDVLVDNQQLPAANTRMGQTLFVAPVNLTHGTHTLLLRAKPDHDVRADFVLLSTDPTVAGYDFAMRTVPVQ